MPGYDSLLIDEVTIFYFIDDEEATFGQPGGTYHEGATEPARVEISGAKPERSSTEALGGRDETRTLYLVFLRPDADVTGIDYLDWHGRRLDVRGEPEYVQGGSAAVHHVEVPCEEIVGG